MFFLPNSISTTGTAAAPQIVYRTEPNTTAIHQTTLPTVVHQQQIQPQLVCIDDPNTSIQPTMINQIPVFNTITNNTTSPSIMAVQQSPLQRATSFVISQPQSQPQSVQLLTHTAPQVQMIPQTAQPLQIISNSVPQTAQPLQLISNPVPQHAQLIQLNGNQAPQLVQTVQPQLIQGID